MDTKISVVITTYKRDEKYFERALLSVLNQTYTNTEVIVVDDNGRSTEYQSIVANTIEKYSKEKTIHYLINESNLGVQKSRNRGLDAASGEYIAYLDDDDEWLPNKLEKQMYIFNFYPNMKIGLVYCWYIVLEEKDNQITKTIIEAPEYHTNKAYKKLLQKNYIASTSLPLIKKEVLIKVGKFDEELLASQDYDVWVRIAKEYEIKVSPYPLANYYKHGGERITSNFRKKEIAEKMFLEKHYEDIKEDKLALADKHLKIGVYLSKQNKKKEAREHLLKSLINYPKNIKIYKYIFDTFI